jgi:hypothetical protein
VGSLEIHLGSELGWLAEDISQGFGLLVVGVLVNLLTPHSLREICNEGFVTIELGLAHDGALQCLQGVEGG